MIDARLDLAPDRTVAPPWPQRFATLGVFLANGLGIGSWAAAIPRLKADLALSDAGLSVALMAFAAGAIVAMLLMGLFGHRLRSGPASVIAGFAFAGALILLGFAQSLETLSAATFLAGMTNGAMDVAMNANASDVERRWGRPIMSSFHAAFSLGGAAGALLGGWLGDRGTGLGLLGPALISTLLVALAVPFLAREGGGFGGAGFIAAPSRRLLPLAALAFVLMAAEGAVGDWSGTYLARFGVDPGLTTSRLCGVFASDDHRQGRRRRDRRRRRTARDGWLWRAYLRGRARDQRCMAGACRRNYRVRTGWRGPRQCRAGPLQRRRADGVIGGGWRRFRRNRRLRGSARGAGHHWRSGVRNWLALGDRHAGGRCAACGSIRGVESGRARARAVKASRQSLNPKIGTHTSNASGATTFLVQLESIPGSRWLTLQSTCLERTACQFSRARPTPTDAPDLPDLQGFQAREDADGVRRPEPRRLSFLPYQRNDRQLKSVAIRHRRPLHPGRDAAPFRRTCSPIGASTGRATTST